MIQFEEINITSTASAMAPTPEGLVCGVFDCTVGRVCGINCPDTTGSACGLGCDS